MSAHHYCNINCGGTDCDAPVSYTTTAPRCKHENGWYVTVKFWIFTKRVFVCSDCGTATPTTPKEPTP